MYSLFLHTPHANEPPIFEASVYICKYIVSYALPAIVGFAQFYLPVVLRLHMFHLYLTRTNIFLCAGERCCNPES